MNIVQIIEDYCTLNNIRFLYETHKIQNWRLDQLELQDDELVLTMLPYSISGRNAKAGISPNITYSCFFLLGQKSEAAGTMSILDETTTEKHKRRLYDLLMKMIEIIKELSCAAELELINYNLDFEYNIFDLNIDMVGGNVVYST